MGGPFGFRGQTLEGYQCSNTRVRLSPDFADVVTQILSRIQETLRKTFAALADGFHERLRAISLELSAVEGPLEEQQRQIEEIQKRINSLSGGLETVEAAEAECVAAKVEENDYTVFSCQDLEFELELVVQSIAKKISFIDNQARFEVPSGAHELTNVLADRLTQLDQSNSSTDRTIREYLPVL